MPVEHLPAAEADAEAVAALLRRDGCVVVDDLAPADQLDRFEAEIAPYLADTPAGSDEFSGLRTRRTGSLIARSPAARELVTHPLALGVCGEVLGPKRSAYQLHLTQVIAIGPDSPAQMVHRDQWAFDFFPFPTGMDVQVNTIWALTDFTEANGATRVIPGSNHWEDKLRPTFQDTIPALMRRGSVLFYTGSLYHGGGANSTDAVRMGINLTYCRSFLRQEENQYLACPQEVARTLDEGLLRLMGYSRGAYALGYVGDLHDPLDVLLGREAKASSSLAV
ncbi:MAG: phytanoyl-CoA dioxygenase family protein [Acidimicrobiia bacterium]